MLEQEARTSLKGKGDTLSLLKSLAFAVVLPFATIALMIAIGWILHLLFVPAGQTITIPSHTKNFLLVLPWLMSGRIVYDAFMKWQHGVDEPSDIGQKQGPAAESKVTQLEWWEWPNTWWANLILWVVVLGMSFAFLRIGSLDAGYDIERKRLIQRMRDLDNGGWEAANDG